MAVHADGEKNDAPLVPDLLAHLRTQITSKPRIIVADAQFCDLVQISQYGRAGDHFALRYHPKLHFHAAAAWPGRAFTDAKGRPLIEEYGWLGSPTDKRRRFVRRVTWKRTDHKDLGVVTDLTNRQPGQDAATPEPIAAADVIDLYLIRWRIETVFQDVTKELYLTEEMAGPPYDADNLYGWAKLMAEMTLKAYARDLGMKAARDKRKQKKEAKPISRREAKAAELIPPPDAEIEAARAANPNFAKPMLKLGAQRRAS